ncbi:hypothetical protein RB195_021383 [Necator americanus]
MMKCLLFLLFSLVLVSGNGEDCLEPFGKTGHCKASFKRWGFNPETIRCEEFIYGGCGGNKNNFLSLEECKMECKP